MIIIAVDDEALALEGILGIIKRVSPGATIQGFRDGENALKFCRENQVEVAFLDIEMRTMGGMELAARLKDFCPRMNIIFTTGYDDYMSDAFAMHSSGYILKPITEEKIRNELLNLRFPVEGLKERIKIHTFGIFEAYYGGKPLKFNYSKTKELFAVLVDAEGAMLTNGYIISNLWEDEPGEHTSYFRNLLSDLTKTLKSIGCEEVLLRSRGLLGLDVSALDCDYYDYLKGKLPEAFKGEYMSQYSWGEETLAQLDNQ